MKRALLALLLLPSAALAAEQTTVDAARLEVDDNAGTATFTGGVVVDQPTLHLTGARLVVDYGKGKAGRGGITKMTASGNVVIVRKGGDVPETAKGATAIYYPATQRLTLLDNVTLTHGANTLTGDRLDYDIKAGKANVTSKSRVRANLGNAPDKADTAPATTKPATP
jgi:lipopolysaccharide export system protein LptA